jgi:hypothetical protein
LKGLWGRRQLILATLIRGWKPTGSLSFKVLGENLFLMEFEHSWDKSRVLEGRLWIFEGNLFSVVDYDGPTLPNQMVFDSETFWIRMYDLPLSCMGRAMGYNLGASVGTMEEVDTNKDGIDVKSSIIPKA